MVKHEGTYTRTMGGPTRYHCSCGWQGLPSIHAEQAHVEFQRHQRGDDDLLRRAATLIYLADERGCLTCTRKPGQPHYADCMQARWLEDWQAMLS